MTLFFDKKYLNMGGGRSDFRIKLKGTVDVLLSDPPFTYI